MNKRYAYSLNGSDWKGDFATRKDARLAALDATREMADLPSTVFVGAIVPTDPQISGHARALIECINTRADAAGTGEYLNGLKVDQVEDLEKELSATLASWLKRNRLEPTSFNVNAISEYPVPLPPTVTSGPSDEVRDVGQSRDPLNFQ